MKAAGVDEVGQLRMAFDQMRISLKARLEELNSLLKVSQGDRTLFYVTPKAGSFEATVVLGERATQAALNGGVSKKLHSSIRAAKTYVEGRVVRVVVTDQADLASVEQLVAVKLDPTHTTPATSSQRRRRGLTRT